MDYLQLRIQIHFDEVWETQDGNKIRLFSEDPLKTLYNYSIT